MIATRLTKRDIATIAVFVVLLIGLFAAAVAAVVVLLAGLATWLR